MKEVNKVSMFGKKGKALIGENSLIIQWFTKMYCD